MLSLYRIYEGILNSDDEIQNNISKRLYDLFTPDGNHRVRVNIKDWIKNADLEQYVKLLDNALYDLRKARDKYDDTRTVRLKCEDGELNIRLFKTTRGGTRGWIHWNVALSKQFLKSSWKMSEEYIKQRDKMKNWDWWEFLPTGTTRKQCIEKIKRALQTNLDSLFIQ